ncbi:plasma kallikrein-like [Ixodes scapularis]|uniref:plasma kallikrein-like n=1 Tax=Ixodes scapularis TaxID=6945 RepID=UPI001A9F9FCB|nr:plasma kallikrein-like [Ixodes scapularis]
MPICLPEKNQVFDNRTCTATGWGYLKDKSMGGGTVSNVLQKVDLPTVPYNECKNDYRNVNTVVEETMICAGPKEGGKSACQGDSGGPLQCSRSDDRYVLAGCTSWGTVFGKANQPTVFARVSTQLDWIAASLERHHESPAAFWPPCFARIDPCNHSVWPCFIDLF